MSHTDWSSLEGAIGVDHYAVDNLHGYPIETLHGIFEKLTGIDFGGVGISDNGGNCEFHVSDSMSSANKAKIKGFLNNRNKLGIVSRVDGSVVKVKYDPADAEAQGISSYFLAVSGSILAGWGDIQTSDAFYSAGSVHFKATLEAGAHRVLLVSMDSPYKSGEVDVVIT